MHPQIPMIRTTVQTQINAKRDRGPSRVFGAAVEADLVGFFALELVEDGVREGFGCERHVCCMETVNTWCTGGKEGVEQEEEEYGR